MCALCCFLCQRHFVGTKLPLQATITIKAGNNCLQQNRRLKPRVQEEFLKGWNRHFENRFGQGLFFAHFFHIRITRKNRKYPPPVHYFHVYCLDITQVSLILLTIMAKIIVKRLFSFRDASADSTGFHPAAGFFLFAYPTGRYKHPAKWPVVPLFTGYRTPQRHNNPLKQKGLYKNRH